MNRDIITADIEWGLNGEYNASPILNLKVEIDDADFSRNIYIEDIKLYNQNTFVNPTNASGGISIINVPIVNNNPSIDNMKKITVNSVDNFFEGDGEIIIGHFYKNSQEVWVERTQEDTTVITETYSLGEYYYSSNYTRLLFSDIPTFDITKNDIFIRTDKIKIYDYNDLQNDPLFTQNFDISNDIIIISIKIHPNPDDKCQSDYILKAVYNKRLLLLESMAGVREIADTCTIPRRFIDFILRQKAIDLAQENNDIDLLCKYFKMFSGSIGTNKIEFAPCGCLRG